ncbi:MAG: neutral/alkaline non-lysosomal ceramidase N-terminal domain-containing protein [Candidatus Latescibacterota bacterium]
MRKARGRTVFSTPQAHCRFGVGRADITPPADAYHRNWGAALHDAAEGIHRPLLASVAVFQPLEGGPECVLVTVDLGWLTTNEVTGVLERTASLTGADPEHLALTFSHTHSAINLDLSRTAEPGGQHIRPYLDALPGRIAAAVEGARAAAGPAFLTFGIGSCTLAVPRDHWDAERGEFTCGPEPFQAGDSAVWVVRAADARGRPLAHLVNYACHPTTLAWENRLISPDYIGAMREVVEKATDVPCLFLQGPCGDLGPRDGFVGDVAVADRNGRQLGYAALSAIESLPPPGTRMRYTGALVSGATLGLWEHEPLPAAELARAQVVRTAQLRLELPCRPSRARGELEERRAEWQRREETARASGRQDEVRECCARVERLRRAVRRLEERPASGRADYRVQVWQFGQAVMVTLGGEPYNWLQRALRQRFPGLPILIGEVTNLTVSYILPAPLCGTGRYQDECSTLEAGALETIADAITAQLRAWGLGAH